MNRVFSQLMGPLSFESKIRLDEKTLLEYHKLAIQYNVELLFYAQLQRYLKDVGEDAVVDVFLRKNKSKILHLVAFLLPQRSIETDLLRIFREAEVDAVVLKGSAIAQDIYGNINSRVSCDLDILVKELDVERVDTILLGNGYVRHDTEPLAFLKYRRHHTVYLSQDSRYKLPIEIHWNFSIPGFFRLTSEEIWQQVKKSQSGSCNLSFEMNLILLSMHHHMHGFKQFRNILDLLWAFTVYDKKIDWREFSKDLQQIGLQGSVDIALKQMEKLWPVESKRLRGLQVVKRQADKTHLFPVHHLTAIESSAGQMTLKDKLVMRLTLDGLRAFCFSFIKSVLPSPQVLEELYKDQKKSMLVSNYIRYMRWRFFSR